MASVGSLRVSVRKECAEYRKKAQKRTHLEAFSREFLSCLASALNDGSRTPLVDNLLKIRDSTCSDDGPPQTASQAILKARKAIGRDNEAYLQCGLMVLWCGDSMENDLAHPLYPSSLALSALPERPGYGEERVIENLLEQTVMQLRALRMFVEIAAPRRVAYLLSIPEIAAYVLAVLRDSKENGLRLDGLDAVKRELNVTDNTGSGSNGLQASSCTCSTSSPSAPASTNPDGLLTTMGSAWNQKRSEDRSTLEGAIRTLLKQEDGLPGTALSTLLCTLCDRTEAMSLVETLVESVDDPQERTSDTVCHDIRTKLKIQDKGSNSDPMEGSKLGDFSSFRRAMVWLHDAHLWQHCDTDDVSPSSVPMAQDVRSLFVPDVVDGPKDGVRAAFVNARSVRMVKSLAINLRCKGACNTPPHMRFSDGVRNEYRVPHTDSIELFKSVAAVNAHTRPMGVHEAISMNLAEAFQLIEMLKQKRSDKTYASRVLWTPTRTDDSDAHIGGLSLTPASLHVSYATYLAEMMSNIKSSERLPFIWSKAVFKLEMMPSLSYVYELVARGDDVQTAISSSHTTTTQTLTSNMLNSEATNPLMSTPYTVQEGKLNSLCGIVHLNEINKYPGDTYGGIDSKRFNEDDLQPLSKADFDERNDGKPNPFGDNLSRVPAFASPDGVAELAMRLGQLHSTNRRLEAQREAYQSALDDLRSERDDSAEYGRAAGESALPDADDRGRRDAIWQDALRELSIGGDRLYTFLKVRPLAKTLFLLPLQIVCPHISRALTYNGIAGCESQVMAGMRTYLTIPRRTLCCNTRRQLCACHARALALVALHATKVPRLPLLTYLSY